MTIDELENGLLIKLAERLNGCQPVELTEGGSPARLVRLRRPGNELIVLKLLVDLPGAVDGHDLASFRLKISQIAKVRREIPDLRAVYTDLCEQFHGSNWSAYTMPFYHNEDIAACLRQDGGLLGQFWAQTEKVLADLITHGYLHARVPAPVDDIVNVHIDRLERRYWLLQKYLPPELTGASIVTINGVRCRNPLKLSRELRDSAIVGSISPLRVHYPVHGDLNTRNILITRDGYRIIDPRGTIGFWDPTYDIAKILFSLTVWDCGLRRGFTIERNGEWHVGVKGGSYPGYRDAAWDFLPRLMDLDVIGQLAANDPGWGSRLLLSHAFHVLAEAPCRLSDIKKRTSELGADQISPLELATGHYLVGTLLLEDAARQLARDGAIDHEATLKMLELCW